MKKTWKGRILKGFILSLLALFLLSGLFYLVLGLFPDPLEEGAGWDWTKRVTDRHGRVLKEYLSPSMSKRDFVALSRISPHLKEAIITAEDKRFYYHPGFDPLAVMRAAKINLSRGAIVSGGSTITMQLARLTLGLSPGPRTFTRKLKETWLALLIERHHTKDEILESYLNLVPTGRLTVGVEAAARLYLGKGADTLSPAEAAFLAAIPASPGSLDPYRHFDRTIKRRNEILKRMEERGYLDPEAATRAQAESLSLNYSPPPYLAPHFVSYVTRYLPHEPSESLRSTLDLELQERLEALASESVESYREMGLEQVSILVMSLPEREVLAWVGSGDFFNQKDGQLDGVLAPRQPGSALKPFIYAMAFDRGNIYPSSRLSDAPVDYVGTGEVFSPRNYSGDFTQPVSARVALASSLNIPAVNLASELGVDAVLDNLRTIGLDSLDQDHEHYGLGLALGDGEVNLLSLTTAYAMLADGGVLAPPIYFLKPLSPKSDFPFKKKNVLSPTAAFVVSDILADDQARKLGFGYNGILNTPYPSSVKTGTSSNFRDNWCVGYTDKYVVGVWAGNFAAQPMTRISGVTGAGQLWREAMDILTKDSPPKPLKVPKGVKAVAICPISGLPAGPDCPNTLMEYFLEKIPLPPSCDHHKMQDLLVLGEQPGFRLLTPITREIYAYDPGLPPEQQRLRALTQSVPEVTELVWILNGHELERTKTQGYSRRSIFLPLEKGANQLQVLGLREFGEPLRTEARYSVK
ncbi:MAG: penicillin-binding protein 1C [Deltaproteobacteria bacterium]|nr:penicillin-binding protein 1C [Deltaproteobacteria bacterium]